MEFRKVFDQIPEQFDQYRPRYCSALFQDLISFAGIGRDTDVLELGPGTGQATEPVLQTGCRYLGIELGENLARKMRQKFSSYSNFSLVQDDFIPHDFGNRRFDLIYSAATIQWIPEEIAFSKTFSLLKPGGTLAMMLTHADYQTPDPALYDRIQQVYTRYFKPEIPYKQGKFDYANAPQYGYIGFEKRTYSGERVLTADEYVGLCGTHCDHLVIPEPYKTLFFDGLRQAVQDAGNQIRFQDTYILYLTKKPGK